MADIFLSYAHQDEGRIKVLVEALRERGWSVFWDRHIPAGQTWREYIGCALNEARCVIVVWSSHSVASSWVAEEADEARRCRKLIPVLLDAVELPLGFRSVQTADLSAWNPSESSNSFERFAEDVAAVLGQGGRAKGDERGEVAQPPQHGTAPRPQQSRRRLVPLTGGVVTIAVLVGMWVGHRTGQMPLVPEEAPEGPAVPRPGSSQPAAAAELPFFLQRPVRDADLKDKSDWELDVMRNEIYARHGRRFTRSDLQLHFEQQPWYVSKYSPEDFQLALLTELERSNAIQIRLFQERRQLSK